jgi:DNA-binding beta-propeller fold protein YncE
MRNTSRVLALVTLGLFSMCADERPTSTVSTAARFYVTAYGGDPPLLFVFDTNNDSLIDTLPQSRDWGDFQIACDPDEPRFLVNHGRDAKLYSDGGSMAVWHDSLPTVYAAFDSRRNLLVGTRGSFGGVIAPLLNVYDPISRAVQYSDTIPLAIHFRLDRARGLAYGIVTYELTPTGDPDLRQELCAYDYINRQVHRCWSVLPDTSGRGLLIRQFTLHPDSKRAYITAESTDGSSQLVGLDLANGTHFFNVAIYRPWGEPAISPDGTEVWYPERGLDLSSDPETITIYNASTGDVKGQIDLGGYRPLPNRPIRPAHIRFVPSGEKCYVSCYGPGGPVLVIDVARHEVTKVFKLFTGSSPERIVSQADMGPAP